MHPRLLIGLRYVAGKFAPTCDQFRKDNGEGGDMLLDGLLSQGFVNRSEDRVAVSPTGLRVLDSLKAPAERAR